MAPITHADRARPSKQWLEPKWLEPPLLRSLGGTYGRILDFSFGGRTENGHEMVLEWVSGVDFTFVLTFFEPDPFAGLLGPSFAGKRAKPETQIQVLVS